LLPEFRKPFEKRFERKPLVTAWSSGATIGDQPAQWLCLSENDEKAWFWVA